MENRIQLIIVLFFIVSSNIFGQTCDWTQFGYNGGNDYVIDVDVDDKGFIYTTGRAKSVTIWGNLIDTITIRPDFYGSADTYVCKYSPNGEIIWAKRAGGANEDWGYGITVDEDGNVFNTGVFRDYIIFGSDTINASGGDNIGNIFISKYDNDGNELWLNYFEGQAGIGRGQRVVANSEGAIFGTGYMQGRNIVGTDTVGDFSNRLRPYLVKYGSDGTLHFIEDFGIEGFGQDMIMTKDSNIVVCGSTGRANGKGILLRKYDQSGKMVWDKSINSPGSDKAFAVSEDDSGNLYLGGLFTDDLVFDNDTISSKNEEDAFLAKYDKDGNTIWARHIITHDSTFEMSDIEVYGNNILVVGRYWGNLTFETGEVLSTSGGGDGYMVNFDTLGNLKWIKPFGGPPNLFGDCGGKCSDGLNALAFDKDYNLFVGGYVKDTVRFDSTSYNGMLGTTSVVAKMFLPIEPDIGLSETEICQDGSVQFKGLGYGTPLSYKWNFEKGTPDSSTDKTGDVSFSESGSQDVSLIISNPYVSDTLYLSDAIVVYDNPIIDLGADTIICSNQTIELGVNDSFDSYSWSNGETNSTIIVDSSGTFSLTVEDTNGCVGIDEINVTVDPCTSVDDLISTKSLVFPNPSVGEVNVVTEIDFAEIILYSYTGQEVFKTQLRAGKNYFTIPSEISGILFFNIQKENLILERGKLFIIKE